MPFELELSSQKTADTLTSSKESIDYDEAIRRAGGVGAYQIFMLLAYGILSIYGDALIIGFVYMTSTHKLNCKYEGENLFRECTKEEVCANFLNPEFVTQPITTDKDYIYSLTGLSHEVNCWSETAIAFLGQLWFMGFLSKILATPLLEKFGYLRVLKVLIIPLNILSFNF